jgi:threonine dehydratase
VLRCAGLEELLGGDRRVYGKLEFLQHTGTFKVRGALATIASLTATQRRAGVTAVSAGNHALATAYAAQAVGASAKIVMISTANAARVDACRAYGAELVFTNDIHEAFEIVDAIQEEEGRILVHPFEGPDVAKGTGTVGLEMCEQLSEFDAVIVPVGGGGLIAGVANAIKRLRPEVEVIGVEPVGADSMRRSLAAGAPQALHKVNTIADSLGAPFAMPYSFALCRENVDRIVLVEDLQLRKAMGLLFRIMKIAVEPACAATTAALLGPLREELQGKIVALVFCGSNIDWDTFAGHAIFENE